MTVNTGQQAQTVDPLASQRTELIGQLVASQFALEAALADLSSADPTVRDQLRGQLSIIAGLRQQVGFAPAAALAALKADVAAAAGNAAAVAQEARSGLAAGGGAGGQGMTLQQARQAVESVSHDLFERHVLDPYLTFRDAEDERAYRERERERKTEIEKALASNTPEGNRLAARIGREQLADAKSHGGDRAPEFAELNRKTEAASIALEQAAKPDLPKDRGPSQPSNKVADIAATLKAAGLTTPSTDNASDGHGLNLDKLAALGRANDGRS